jgi:ATP-dependent helicase/nuclease subunit B
LCAERVLDDKILLTPTLRVGMQWLDAVARSGQPVLNFRVETLRAFALELATPAMEARGLTFVRGVRAEILIDRVFAAVSDGKEGYVTGLEPGPGLTETLSRAIRDLRLADIRAADLSTADFEVAEKGRDIKALLAAFEEEIDAADEVDYPGAVGLAVERLEKDPAYLDGSTLVVMPRDMESEAAGLERRFLEALPSGSLMMLETDIPGEPERPPSTDASLLSWIAAPAEAPDARTRDGTASIFRAVGEVNEVREVLRRCVEGGIPFDDVEVLHTDPDTYVPLIYELCRGLKSEDDASIPVTFYEGIPSIYFRPARALMGWLSWLAGGAYPQVVLVRMISEGLLDIEGGEREGPSFARLAAVLRAVPIGGTHGRYLPAIDHELEALRHKVEAGGSSLAEEEDEVQTPARRQARLESLRLRIAGLERIRTLVERMLDISAGAGRDQCSFLEAAREFLQKQARRVSEFDQYCHRRLIDDIAKLADCLREGDVAGLEPAAWLAALPGKSAIEGKGPRPGCLYVAPVRSGGHSGRGHTFIIGLDDSRFPGTGRQDPLILDSERGRISEELPTGAGRLAGEVQDFARLLARLRGNVTLGYCCLSLTDDREMFPSPVVLSAYRILEKRDGDQGDLGRWAGAPVSFAPSSPGRCIDATEWWLSRTCGEVELKDIEATISSAFGNLGRGLAAVSARASDLFTEYDGYVPEAGYACDPAARWGHVLSASRLETLARCPLEYFFKYILDIEPPEEFEIDPTAWLDQSKKGLLLHSAYREFMRRLIAQGGRPDFERDMPLLKRIIDAQIVSWEARRPAPSRAMLERDRGELYLAGRIFLQEEERYCRSATPAYCEAAIGIGPEAQGTPLDCPEPVALLLPGVGTVKVSGRVDRIDELLPEGSGLYAVWDYKTGGSERYDLADPFDQGRRLQGVIYLELAGARLGELHPGAKVVKFGYFFPSARAHGERLEWESHELDAGRSVVSLLCRMISAGVFPFTAQPDDVRFSDYKHAFGRAEGAAADISRKLANPANEMLQPFRDLKGSGP